MTAGPFLPIFGAWVAIRDGDERYRLSLETVEVEDADSDR
jgi:hypothetical protein